MKNFRLNALHRYVGITLAPFLVIQTVSGLMLGFGLFRSEAAATERGALERFLVQIHFGPGLLSDLCHVLLAAGIFWMAVSGWVLFLRIRRTRRKPQENL